jgi:protein-S-isoprenylcysteine O-methyltransferase Ste14
MTFEFVPTLAFVVVMICWFVFPGAFLLRRKPPSPPDSKRAPRSNVGLVLQGLSYAFVWGGYREPFTPIIAGSETRKLVAIGASVFAIGVAIFSVWLTTTAVKTLGKEWSLTARLVEGHKLATSGPYAYVRHPIYSGMLGMLVATGLAVSHWAALLAGLVVFFVGTIIRVRSEEKLLREAFGDEFENYARRVPAIVPGVY